MDLIILNAEQKAQVDTKTICGIENFQPVGTYRYNMDKYTHIKLELDLTDEQMSELVFNRDLIVENDPQLEEGL